MQNKIIPIVEDNQELALKVGRPCCGGRTMCLHSEGEKTKSRFVDFREFEGWYCSVNWFFMHIEQQTNSVYHHQTCKSKFDGTVGPIGSLDDADAILEELERNLSNNTMPTMVCPKKTCGCGLCAPKSISREKYNSVLASHVDMRVFEQLDKY